MTFCNVVYYPKADFFLSEQLIFRKLFKKLPGIQLLVESVTNVTSPGKQTMVSVLVFEISVARQSTKFNLLTP